MGVCSSNNIKYDGEYKRLQQNSPIKKAAAKYTTLVVGDNSHGSLCLNHVFDVQKLTRFPLLDISVEIYSGEHYMILKPQHPGDYYVGVGMNNYGQLGISNNESPIICLTEIDYFRAHKINIQKLCVSINGFCTFWITDDKNVYGNGRNDRNQLGLTRMDLLETYSHMFQSARYADTTNVVQKIADMHRHSFSAVNRPTLIEFFTSIYNVIDIQSSHDYTIALCSNNYDVTKTIIHYLSKLKDIPMDITNMIVDYCCKMHGTVLSTQNAKWQTIPMLSNEDIVSISAGYYHYLFLASNGAIWSNGNNLYGQLGVSTDESNGTDTPQRIEYFSNNKIKITNIVCGANHNLAIDDNYNVYSWGNNFDGQCGDSTRSDVATPKLMRFFKDCDVVRIVCGAYHSYCKTSEQMHYLFGSNGCNECITNDNTRYVITPHCVNDMVGKRIKSISLGTNNTKIVAY
eukprot:28761_1